ncbi:MAG: metal ABC transporter substrate-binding protein [Acutalibacteraceae bacterium]
MIKGLKRIWSLISALLILLCLCACSGEGKAEDGKVKVVCTVFPIYDWTREIAKDKAEISWLLSKGTDMHSFQPSAADMIEIAECDLLIYVGGESDEWVSNAIGLYENKNRYIVNLSELLGDNIYKEEHTEGMQEERHSHGEEEEESDEHVWLSLNNAALFAENIAEVLGEKDPDNAEFYRENALEYSEKILSLDGEYRAAVSGARLKTLLVADRFPFRYLTEDYGLSYYAAFPGCSAETEASFETVAFLSAKTDELGLKYVIITETAGTKIADTVIANTREKNQEILVLDSMQSVGKKDAENGVTYLTVMQKNLETLKKALS